MKGRRRVLVTHANEPLGSAVIQRLMSDPTVERLETVGDPKSDPPFEARFAQDPERLRHHTADLSKPRDVEELFAQADVDAVILVPRSGGGSPRGRTWLAEVPPRTVETRLILEKCLEISGIGQLVALSSVAAYQLAPNNANRIDESNPLELAPDWSASARSWVDCDMLLHAEIHHPTLCVSALRIPTVLTSEGELVLAPAPGAFVRPRVAGFDPMCSLVVDRDVVQAVLLALHMRARGAFNISGPQAVPLSVLDRAQRAQRITLPGPLMTAFGIALRRLGATELAAQLDTPQIRFGASFDTARAERELGFKPSYRVGLERHADGSARLEARPL